MGVKDSADRYASEYLPTTPNITLIYPINIPPPSPNYSKDVLKKIGIFFSEN